MSTERDVVLKDIEDNKAELAAVKKDLEKATDPGEKSELRKDIRILRETIETLEKRALVLTPAQGATGNLMDESASYKDLLAAKEDKLCLSLEEGSSFPLTSSEKMKQMVGQNKILARRSTKHLFEISQWVMQGNKVDGMARKGVIISGPPGDGKSFSSQYFLTKLVQQKDRHVVYENVQMKRVWVYRMDGVCRSYDGPATMGNCPELQEEDTAYIFDASASNNSSYEPVMCRAWLFFFSSANEMSKKQTQRGRFLELGFVTPSIEELRVAIEVIRYNSNTDSIDAQSDLASIDAQVDLFGGRMRWIFDKPLTDVHASIDKAVRNFDIDKIGAILCGQVDSKIGHEGGVPTSLFSTFLDNTLLNKLNQCEESLPQSAEKDTKRMEALINLYREGNLKWYLSGEVVFRKITDKYKSSLNVLLEKLGEATVNTQFGGLAGHSLQTKAAELLAAGGDFKMRVLVPPNSGGSLKSETLTLVERKLVPLTVKVANNIENVLRNYNEAGSLYHICGNFKGVDSIAPPDMSFQHTSSGGHSADLETTARMNEHALANGSKKPLTQAFVVPDEMFDAWTREQPYQFRSTTIVLKLGEQQVWEGCFQGSVLMSGPIINTLGLIVEVDNREWVIVKLNKDEVKVSKTYISKMKANSTLPIKLGKLTIDMSLTRITDSLQHTALCGAQRKRLLGVRQVVIGVPFSLWEHPRDAAKRMGLLTGLTRTMSTLAAGRGKVSRAGSNGLSVVRAAGGILRRVFA